MKLLNINEFKHSLNESTNNLITIDVDVSIDPEEESEALAAFKEYGIEFEETGDTTADLTGTKENLIKYLTSDYYGWDIEDIKSVWPELFESVNESDAHSKEGIKTQMINYAIAAGRPVTHKELLNVYLKSVGLENTPENRGRGSSYFSGKGVNPFGPATSGTYKEAPFLVPSKKEPRYFQKTSDRKYIVVGI